MSKKIFNTLIVASSYLLSQQAFAQTCFYEDVNTNGPVGPSTCVNINVVDVSDNLVSLEVRAIRKGEDISNYFRWRSDIDGSIGVGSQIVANLSDGKHNISVMAEIPHLQPYYDHTEIDLTANKAECADELPSVAHTYNEWYNLEFTNINRAQVNLYWLRYEDGERIHYKSLSPNESVSLSGYPGNKWVATDENNSCLSVYSTSYRNESYTFE